MRRAAKGLLAFSLALAACGNCGKGDSNNGQMDASGSDVGTPDAGTADVNQPDLSSTPDAAVPGEQVHIDLDEHLGQTVAGKSARVYQLEGEAPFSGPVVAGRAGDWVVENDRVRFLIEGDNRAMSPCPWGGTIVDAAYLEDGTDEDILGEVCMMVNGGLSFRPDRFDIISDGSDGRAAVLAASGGFAVNDFLNLRVMVDDFVSGLGDRIHVDINRILPVRLTIYYILRPDDTGVDVVTAMRNDSDAQVDLLPLYMVASGGDGQYYNPQSSSGGFGSGLAQFGAALEDLPFLVFAGETAGYGFAPKPDPTLPAQTLPLAGAYIVISGVAAALMGTTAAAILPLLTMTEEQLAEHRQVTHIAPNEIAILEHHLFAGSGSIATIVDPIYELNEVQTGTMRGIVRDTDGAPVAGARVSAIRRGIKTMNQAVTDAAGNFVMDVPAEAYEVVARKGGMAPLGPVDVVVEPGADITVNEVQVKSPATVRVRVTTPDDGCANTSGPMPVAARLSVLCDGDCPDAPGKTETDTGRNSLPAAFAAIEYADLSGVLEVDLPAGSYRLVVDRGMEWSTWPSDAVSNGGLAVNLVPGETVELDAEIARVLDTPAAYSGDFHIHSVTSSDSPVPHLDRVKNFLSEGVDVMVSTDHDYISDYSPVITEIGADAYIQGIVGDEVTTADLGHFNAFPLVRDAAHPRGGALDWGNGADDTLLPAELFRQLRESGPGERVIQVNHAEGLGYIKFAQADVLRGISYADRADHRLPPAEPDPVTGDTGIWSDEFTAMELMNGNSRERWYRLSRWWMTMIGRGFTPTGTAVTDTHKLYGDLGAVPRTYVFGDTDYGCGDRIFDGLTDYDGFVEAFAADVNRGQALGTNGPFFTVSVQNGAGESAKIGETVTVDDGLTAFLDIQTPEWMRVDAVDVYLNPDFSDLQTRPGEAIGDPIPTTQTLPISWDPADLVTIQSGSSEHRAWRKTIEVPLSAASDAFVVFVVRGNQSMWPVVGTGPFAFSNPVYLDADGNGYDNPPYAAIAAEPPSPDELSPCADAFCGAREPKDPNSLTPREILETIEHLDCQSPGHVH